jgi:hypothetical protein
MRNPLDQALHDAQSVSEWMDDNNVGNESVGFATAWAEIQSVIRYLSAAQQPRALDFAICAPDLHAKYDDEGDLYCRVCGKPLSQ